MLNSLEGNVLIVGAGPSGLALAIILARAGVKFMIIDQRSGTTSLSKATGLEYRVSELMEILGLTAAFQAEAIEPATVNIFRGNRRLVTLPLRISKDDNGSGAFAARGMVIPQSSTEAILENCVNAGGNRVCWGRRLDSHVQDAEGVRATVECENGETEHFTCDWLVSCEGAHSGVRQRENIAFAGHSPKVRFLLADVTLRAPHWSHEANHLWVANEGTFGALPLPGENHWRLTFEVSKLAEEFSIAPSTDELTRLVAARARYILPTITAIAYSTAFDVESRVADQFNIGRIFLAGDAAHVHSPTGAMGISNGLQDVFNLGWKLARVIKCAAPPAILETYGEERIPAIRSIGARIDRNTKAIFSPSRIRRFIRDNLLFPILDTKIIQKRLLPGSSLKIFYTRSALSLLDIEPKARRVIKRSPGARAPDVRFRELQSGVTITLFSCLSAQVPVVLVGDEYVGVNRPRTQSLFSGLEKLALSVFAICRGFPKYSDAKVKYLIDTTGEFEAMYGLRGNYLCLVRPDGHIGLVQQPIDLNGLRSYLLQFSGAEQVAESFNTII
jgi:3-(3-hydroxy-phenyl)propionate hydroxylase